ncbi:MAG: DUF177 domain-containing protein [Actinobacteria bacterium]|nr:DUF177 domain-containing protein [Actinomycetota bacterium]
MIEAIDVRDLLDQPGSAREAHVRGTLEDIGTEVASIPPDIPVEADLLMESVVEGILVTGRLSGRMQLRCARCLRDFEAPLVVEVSEMFVRAPDPEEDDYPLSPEGFLEPEQMVRDTVGLELPFSPLHSPGCKGLCPVCGGDRNLGECPGDHPQVDARWTALDQVLDQLKN